MVRVLSVSCTVPVPYPVYGHRTTVCTGTVGHPYESWRMFAESMVSSEIQLSRSISAYRGNSQRLEESTSPAFSVENGADWGLTGGAKRGTHNPIFCGQMFRLRFWAISASGFI